MDFNELMDAYRERFGDIFPRMEVPDPSEEACAALIRQSLATGKEYIPDIPEDADA